MSGAEAATKRLAASVAVAARLGKSSEWDNWRQATARASVLRLQMIVANCKIRG